MKLSLFLGPDNGPPAVVAEPVLQELSQTLDLLVSAQTPCTRSLGLSGSSMAGKDATLAALLLGLHVVVREEPVIDHSRGVHDDLPIVLLWGRPWSLRVYVHWGGTAWCNMGRGLSQQITEGGERGDAGKRRDPKGRSKPFSVAIPELQGCTLHDGIPRAATWTRNLRRNF